MDETHKIAAIIGITEAIKQYGIPSKLCPSIAIIVGGLIAYAESPTADSVLKGVILGATSTGGYAVVKRSGRGMIQMFSPEAAQKPSPRQDYSQLEPDDYRGV